MDSPDAYSRREVYRTPTLTSREGCCVQRQHGALSLTAGDGVVAVGYSGPLRCHSERRQSTRSGESALVSGETLNPFRATEKGLLPRLGWIALWFQLPNGLWAMQTQQSLGHLPVRTEWAIATACAFGACGIPSADSQEDQASPPFVGRPISSSDWDRSGLCRQRVGTLLQASLGRQPP